MITTADNIEKVTVGHLGECVLRMHDALVDLGAYRAHHGFFCDEQIDRTGDPLITEWLTLPTCFGILAFVVPFATVKRIIERDVPPELKETLMDATTPLHPECLQRGSVLADQGILEMLTHDFTRLVETVKSSSVDRLWPGSPYLPISNIEATTWVLAALMEGLHNEVLASTLDPSVREAAQKLVPEMLHNLVQSYIPGHGWLWSTDMNRLLEALDDEQRHDFWSDHDVADALSFFSRSVVVTFDYAYHLGLQEPSLHPHFEQMDGIVSMSFKDAFIQHLRSVLPWIRGIDMPLDLYRVALDYSTFCSLSWTLTSADYEEIGLSYFQHVVREFLRFDQPGSLLAMQPKRIWLPRQLEGADPVDVQIKIIDPLLLESTSRLLGRMNSLEERLGRRLPQERELLANLIDRVLNRLRYKNRVENEALQHLWSFEEGEARFDLRYSAHALIAYSMYSYNLSSRLVELHQERASVSTRADKTIAREEDEEAWRRVRAIKRRPSTTHRAIEDAVADILAAVGEMVPAERQHELEKIIRDAVTRAVRPILSFRQGIDASYRVSTASYGHDND